MDDEVLGYLDDYAACLECIATRMLRPDHPQMTITKSRRERVLRYIADHATEDQLRRFVGNQSPSVEGEKHG